MAKYLVLTAVVMLVVAIFSSKRHEQQETALKIELQDLIYEARMIREDLEAMLQNVQIASEEVVKNLDQAISARCEQIENKVPTGGKETPPPFSIDDMRRAHPYIMAPRLKELGYSIVQIAEYLNRSTGEIELILSLANRKQKIG